MSVRVSQPWQTSPGVVQRPLWAILWALQLAPLDSPDREASRAAERDEFPEPWLGATTQALDERRFYPRLESGQLGSVRESPTDHHLVGFRRWQRRGRRFQLCARRIPPNRVQVQGAVTVAARDVGVRSAPDA